MEAERTSGAAFYTVSDARYFLGLVALLNSLRLAGHREPLVVLDTGLERGQREVLAPHLELVPAPAGEPSVMLKPWAPLARPADVPVLVDTDMLVTRSLEPLIAQAAQGRTVAFADPLADRFFPEWSRLLDLGPLRPQPYVNAGLLVLSERLAPELLEAVLSRGARVDLARTGRALPGTQKPSPGYPLRFPDQDLWNAVLAARAGADGMVVLEHRLAPFPPFPGLRLLDELSLDCRYEDGSAPYLLHHAGRYKPWLHRTRPTLYSRLLARALVGPDLELPLEPARLPRRLAPGVRGWLARREGELAELARRPRGRLGLRRRLAARRARRPAS